MDQFKKHIKCDVDVFESSSLRSSSEDGGWTVKEQLLKGKQLA